MLSISSSRKMLLADRRETVNRYFLLNHCSITQQGLSAALKPTAGILLVLMKLMNCSLSPG